MGRFAEQLIAPTGYRDLVKDCVYFYLGHVEDGASVLLCSFDHKAKLVHLQYLPREHFEAAVQTGKLTSREHQYTYPFWILPILDADSDLTSDRSLKQYKARHKKAVKKKFKHLKPLLKQQRKILVAPDPMKPIKVYARTQNLNEKRTCFEFFAVVAHRGSRWALLPLSFRSGQSEREFKEGDKRPGRKSKSKGEDYGFVRTAQMKQGIYEGYDQHSGKGMHLTTIWHRTLTKNFGCSQRLVDENSITKREFYHPKGKPFPTWAQFRWAVETHYGKDKIRTDKYGEQRVRNTKRPSKGSFSAQVSNAMEKIEADGYFLDEVPKGERDGNPMPPMCCVRIRDVASGSIVGIGFSIGGETAEAYRSALFCMAIKKSEFGRLMGMEINDEEWPTVGLPSWVVVDRGPGAMKALLKGLSDKVVFRSLAPSYAGQSKAVIESTNPKSVQVSGAPTYVQSNLTYTQLAKREILRAIRDNMRMDVSSRLTPEMIQAGVHGTPLDIYQYLDARFRNDSIPVHQTDAIRSLLKPIEIKANRNGALLHSVNYRSPQLDKSGLLDQTVSRGTMELSGFCVPLCARQIWVDYNDKLVPCNPYFKTREDVRQFNISLVELQNLERLKNLAAAASPESRIALDAEFEQRFQELTGRKWEDGTRKTGRAARKTAAAKGEFDDTKNAMGGTR